MNEKFESLDSKPPEVMNHLEFLDQAYIEIVHVKDQLDALKNLGGKDAVVVQRIEDLDKSRGVHYFEGALDENIPDLPKDTLIAVGGGDWDICVQGRVKQLRKAGFTNVRPIKLISFAGFEELRDQYERKYPKKE